MESFISKRMEDMEKIFEESYKKTFCSVVKLFATII
jgi:hypothetical protein